MIELILYYFEPFKKSLELKVGDKYKMLTKILYLGFRTLGGYILAKLQLLTLNGDVMGVIKILEN